MILDLTLREARGRRSRRCRLPVKIGRDPAADLWLSAPTLSRSQCEVLEEGGQLVVRHLGRQPTQVGDRALRRPGEAAVWSQGAILSLAGIEITWSPAAEGLTREDPAGGRPPASPPRLQDGTVAVLPGELLEVEGRHRSKVAPRWAPTSDLTRWTGLGLTLLLTVGLLLALGAGWLGARGEAALGAGPLSSVHEAVVTGGCESCHLPGAASVSAGCQTCHGLPGQGGDGPAVHRSGAHFSATDGPGCAGCHAEHQGEQTALLPTSGGRCLECHRQAHLGDEARFAPHDLEPRSALPCARCHLGHPAPGQEITRAGDLDRWPTPPARPGPSSLPVSLGLGLVGLTLLPAGGLALWRRRRPAAQGSSGSVEMPIPRAQLPHINALTCVGCRACVDACPFDVLEVVSGVAQVAAAGACHGIALCEAACPNGSLTLVEGPAKEGIPAVTPELESARIPGIFIVGDLTGLPLIKNAINHGVQAIDAISRRPRGEGADVDVAIVGAGPAGLAAAVRAAEVGLRCRIFERETLAHTIRSFPRQKLVMAQPFELPLLGSFPMAECSKEDLLARWEQIVEARGIRVEQGCDVLGVDRRASGAFEVRTSEGTLSAAQVILAIGIRGKPRRLGVPGEDLEKVAYGLSDAQRYTGQRILVVGGGDSALEAALALAAQPGNQVSLSYRKDRIARAKARNRQGFEEAVKEGRIRVLWASQVVEIEPERVMLKAAGETRALGNDFVFVFAGGEPAVGFLRGVGVV